LVVVVVVVVVGEGRSSSRGSSGNPKEIESFNQSFATFFEESDKNTDCLGWGQSAQSYINELENICKEVVSTKTEYKILKLRFYPKKGVTDKEKKIGLLRIQYKVENKIDWMAYIFSPVRDMYDSMLKALDGIELSVEDMALVRSADGGESKAAIAQA